MLRTVPFAFAFVLVAASCGMGRPATADEPAISDDTSDDTLAADLTFLREEEKLARDVYRTLYDRFGLMPHQNIQSSEQRHMDRVKLLLDARGLPDPVRDDATGAFTNAELDALYDSLVATGLASPEAALEVGAVIEDLDLRDIERMTTRTQEPDVLAAYDSLACGSRNHLRAFTSQLAARDLTYAPRYLAPEVFDQILDGAHERCGP